MARSLETPELDWSPRADTRQESMISTEKVHPLVSKSPDLTATIVICTRNRPVELRGCLDAISCLERAPDEVLVIDNTAGNKETESVSHEFGATYIIESIKGLSHARNRGMRESHSAIVIYLDDDAFPEEKWLGLSSSPL